MTEYKTVEGHEIKEFFVYELRNKSLVHVMDIDIEPWPVLSSLLWASEPIICSSGREKTWLRHTTSGFSFLSKRERPTDIMRPSEKYKGIWEPQGDEYRSMYLEKLKAITKTKDGLDELVVRFRAAGRNEDTYILKGNAAERFLEMQEYQEKYEKLIKKIEGLLNDR